MNLEPSDFDCVAQLAKHCDLAKLCIAIEEAEVFDMKPLLCDLFPDVEEHWDDPKGDWDILINGGSYLGCNEKTRTMLGIKRMFIYFAYARYIMLNGWNDTPSGSVQKTNQWSIPKPLKELESFSDKYRTFGYKTWKQVENYLCLNRDLFPSFDPCNCSGCGCNEKCDSGTPKGYGSVGVNLTKYS